MQSALNDFKISMARVRHMHGLYHVFENSLTSAVDLSDILRAEVVMVVSALDRYVHEITKLGMLECYTGLRPKTDAFNKFQIPLSLFDLSAAGNVSAASLETEIRFRHSHLSFQKPDKVADAIRLFSSVSLWDEIAKVMHISAKDAKIILGLIVDRRHKIAHEADIDPSFPGQRWPISAAIVNGMIEKVETMVEAVHSIITK